MDRKSKKKKGGIGKYFKNLFSSPEIDPSTWRKSVIPQESDISPIDHNADRLVTNASSPVTYEQHARVTAHHISQAFKTKALESSNFISSSKQFKQLIKSIFDTIDIDKSGALDLRELYIGVLMVYLQLAKVVVGLVPPSQDDVHALMQQCDTDGDGVVDLDEFDALVAILLSNIVGRVVMQILLQLVLVPALASFLVQLLMTSTSDSVREMMVSYLPPGLLAIVISILIGMVAIAPLLQVVDSYTTNMSYHKRKKS